MISALVVDDVREMADSLCQLLSLLDVNAYPAYGPRAALLSLDEKIPDIVFLDISMPGVSGFEVIKYLRRDPKLEHIPVVVATSDDQKVTIERARREGALEVIIKPVTVEGLESVLKKAKLVK